MSVLLADSFIFYNKLKFSFVLFISRDRNPEFPFYFTVKKLYLSNIKSFVKNEEEFLGFMY